MLLPGIKTQKLFYVGIFSNFYLKAINELLNAI